MTNQLIENEIQDTAVQPKKAWHEPKLECLPIRQTETGGTGTVDGAGTYT